MASPRMLIVDRSDRADSSPMPWPSTTVVRNWSLREIARLADGGVTLETLAVRLLER